MNLKDVNLDEIKLVIFDFDGTLAIHKDKDFTAHRRASEETYLNFFANAYRYPERFYDDIEPCVRSETLYALTLELRKRNIKMYCLSGMGLTFHLKAKQAFVNKHYGDDIDVLTVSEQALKLKGVKILQKIENCNTDEILFVDDLPEVIDMLAENGIKGVVADEEA